MATRKPPRVLETVEVYRAGKPSAFIDTRVVYSGDCLEQRYFSVGVPGFHPGL